MTSLGLVALSLTMFSASGAHASIVTGSLREAIARIAPHTAAAPLMSDFIASIPAAGLSARPPVSKVIPLPTKANVRSDFFGEYLICRSRGGFDDPWPTPMIPP